MKLQFLSNSEQQVIIILYFTGGFRSEKSRSAFWGNDSMSTGDKRQQKIIDLIGAEKKISVSELSERTGVSQVTIRKDLNALEKQGLISRSHGFATVLESTDINNRMDHRYHIKQKMARAAADMVNQGETIMVESGSACALLVRELAEQKKECTVITNSVFIADFVRKSEGIRIIVLGGEYQKESQTLVGPLIRKSSEPFHVDKFFLGTDGWTKSNGFMSQDFMRTEAVKTMASRAEKIIIMTDSEKFFRSSVIHQFQPEEIYAVVTDPGIPDEAEEVLKNSNVRIVKA